MKRTSHNIFRRIFLDHWESFKKSCQSYANDHYEAVVQKMLGCGREEGGYSEYLCPHCGNDLRRICFTCKSCFCISCAKKYTDDFIAQVSRVLHPES